MAYRFLALLGLQVALSVARRIKSQPHLSFPTGEDSIQKLKLGACHQITTRQECLESKSNQESSAASPCTWCCGKTCGSAISGAPMCAPFQDLTEGNLAKVWDKQGENGAGHQSCTPDHFTSKDNVAEVDVSVDGSRSGSGSGSKKSATVDNQDPHKAWYDNVRDNIYEHIDNWTRAGFAIFCVLLYVILVIVWQCKGGHSLELASILPGAIRCLIPHSFRTIQDINHLTLMVSLILGMFMFTKDVYNISTQQCAVTSTQSRYCGCINEVVNLAFLTPCTLYIFRMLQYYDDRGQSKRRALEEVKMDVSMAYSSLLCEMDRLTNKAVESNASLAERHVDSLKRDQLHFLQSLKLRIQSFGDSVSSRNSEILQATQRFIAHWLCVFEQTSLNPCADPRVGEPITFKSVLESTTDTVEALQGLAYVLEDEDVRFIKQDTEELVEMETKAAHNGWIKPGCGQAVPEATKSELEKLDKAAHKVGAAFRGWKARKQVAEAKRAVSTEAEGKNKAGANLGVKFNQHLNAIRADEMHHYMQNKVHACCACVALKPKGFYMKKAKGDQSFPMHVGLGLCEVTFYSCQHLLLLFGIVMGIGILGVYSHVVFLSLFSSREVPPFFFLKVAAIFIYTCSLCMLLASFHRIDVVIKLQAEIDEIDRERARVEAMSERMKSYCGDQQALVIYWLERTIPRLELFKEIENALEDLPKNLTDDELVEELQKCSRTIENLPPGILGGDTSVAFTEDVDFQPRTLINYVDMVSRDGAGDLHKILEVASTSALSLSLPKS